MSAVTKASLYERRAAVTHDSEERLQSVLADASDHGFEIDWPAILRGIASAKDPKKRIESALERELSSAEFDDTVSALALNAGLIAAYTFRKHQEVAGLTRTTPRIVFAESDTFTPTKAIERWRKILGLTDEQVDELADESFAKTALDIKDRVSKKLLKRVIAIYDDGIENGLEVDDVVERLSELMPKASKAELATEYRTTLTDVHAGALEEQIKSSPKTFPFMQFMALIDTGTTWWICKPMGRAGPAKTGYIAATEDDVWLTWRPPCHWNCRSNLSPLGYKEAQRLGILAADGVTKIAIVGSNPDRPFGDPPKFAEDPDTGKLRAVEPQEGFGG